MGYTHYWHKKNEGHDQEIWDKFIADCKELYKNVPEHSLSAGGHYADSPLLLNGCSRFKNATFNKNTVWFNGTAVKKRIKRDSYWENVIPERASESEEYDLGHETFAIERTSKTGGFCKTARKPYDLMVTACLLLYSYHFDDATVETDGEEEDWAEAYKFIAQVFGKRLGTEMKLSDLVNF